jgi:hypothetical protein
MLYYLQIKYILDILLRSKLQNKHVSAVTILAVIQGKLHGRRASPAAGFVNTSVTLLYITVVSNVSFVSYLKK